MSLSFSGRKKGTKESPRILKDEYIFGIRVWNSGYGNSNPKRKGGVPPFWEIAGARPLEFGLFPCSNGW